MLTFPLVSGSLQKVTALWVVDGHVALSIEVTGPGIVRTIADAHRGTISFTSTPGFGAKPKRQSATTCAGASSPQAAH